MLVSAATPARTVKPPLFCALPLAGRRRPADATGGHGLWIVYQVCDLVELTSDANGTTVRMHMALRPSGAAG